MYIKFIQDYLFVVFAFYYYLKCFITEPGIIPKNYHLYNKDNLESFSNSFIQSDVINQTNSSIKLKPRIYTYILMN